MNFGRLAGISTGGTDTPRGRVSRRLLTSLESFNECIDFIGRLTSEKIVERLMGLIRAERL